MRLFQRASILVISFVYGIFSIELVLLLRHMFDDLDMNISIPISIGCLIAPPFLAWSLVATVNLVRFHDHATKVAIIVKDDTMADLEGLLRARNTLWFLLCLPALFVFGEVCRAYLLVFYQSGFWLHPFLHVPADTPVLTETEMAVSLVVSSLILSVVVMSFAIHLWSLDPIPAIRQGLKELINTVHRR